MSEIINKATEYGVERVRRGFEFEVEGSIWHFVLEGAPHAAAGALGVSAVGGHVVVFVGIAALAGVGLVIRRRVVLRRRRMVAEKEQQHALEYERSSLPRSESWR